MDVARLVEGLYEQIDALAEAAGAADPDARVPMCPEWTLRVLVGHVGQAQRWATSIVRSGPSPVPDPLDADPGDQPAWSDWLRTGAESLAEVVASAPDRPVWTFGGEGPATFWLRRMLYDTAVHQADVAEVADRPVTLASDLAADAISELLDLLADPTIAALRPAFGELRGTGQTLRLDAEQSWLITRTPAGLRWTTPDDRSADVTVTGPAADLLLVLTRRLPVDRVAVTGDRALLDDVLSYLEL